MIEPLAVEQLYRPCPSDGFTFSSTAELTPLAETVGQERALESIDFGVGMRRAGYNAYVMGSTGLGKHTVVRQALAVLARRGSVPDDWCYLANFGQPHLPRTLRLPAGRGRQLRQAMEQLLVDLLNAVPAAFQNDEYRRRAQEINDAFKARQEEAATALNQKAREMGVAMLQSPTGYTLAAIRDGKILTAEEFDKLSPEEQKRIESVMPEIERELKDTMAKVPMWHRELHKQLKELEREVSELTVAQLIAELEQSYADLAAVLDYLGELKGDIVEHAELFRAQDAVGGEPGPSSGDRVFNRYRVNLLVDNGNLEGAPVVYEDSPTYQNLLGRVEHVASMGVLSTDFTLIKPGALHKANGGYLVLDVEKLLGNPFAWEALKRALGSAEIRLESLERRLSLVSTMSLEPEPVPIDLKVLLIGDRFLYYLLKAYDPEFGQLFKVAVDFAEHMPREADNEQQFARLLAGLQQREQLRPMTATAVARIVEHCARRATSRDKLSLHMGGLLDLLQEADYWAAQDGAELIDAGHVQSALDHQIHRVDQLREQVRESMLDGTLLVETEGIQLAQVNGLSVVQLGDYAFGMPTRISATARMGGGELIDIEREVKQGGALHSKGVLILGAYLAWRYAKNQPLSVAASLVFEQTYGDVEGDSASAAELCALLSALADIPLRQSLAITGSVSQHGEVQAIGGVCEKIEGFFDLCSARGLDGAQGVIIPEANVQALMLREEVRAAVAAGKFQVYAVAHVEQAMELLTGMRAGMPDGRGTFPADTINGKVQNRLAEWTALRQQFAAPAPPRR